MLKVKKGSYTVSRRENSDTLRYIPALVLVNDRVVVIGGRDFDKNTLATVSSSNLTNDKWVGTLAQLNEGRYAASACFFLSS